MHDEQHTHRPIQNFTFSEEQSVGEYGLYYDDTRMPQEEEEDHPDIRHTAPQHRQFLGQCR